MPNPILGGRAVVAAGDQCDPMAACRNSLKGLVEIRLRTARQRVGDVTVIQKDDV